MMTPDEDLFRGWQGGDASALEALVRRWHAPLVAHLARLTADPALAEDLAQETFLRLVREARAYRYPRPFRPWLYAIARNLARNHWQSARCRREQAGADLAAERPDHAAAASLEQIERWDGLRAALASLSFEQAEVLSLRFGQERSVEETAAALGLPSGTVKSRTFHALRRLRAALEARERGESDDEPALAVRRR